MSARSRAVPRFLPTLTEVVQADDMRSSRAPDDPGTAQRADDDLEGRMLESVRAAVIPSLREAMEGWLRDQLDSPGSPLNLQIEALAREAWAREFAGRPTD